ncbi:PR domain zinc finger protein 5-like isoform X35 [Euwallacea similis]|uniref:PR domain zinc finger protein 5-like isoform X35 n=1 Tax=Euwallacea similis TaxID=1736056 RepID=UPI00344DB685
MDNPGEILRLCRLCLVKDQVNIPIFEEQGDIRQTFLKIRSCLPVKVSRDDKLPKKICGGCSNKLDLFYEFWSSTANSEKTLQSWLGQEEEDDKMQEITKPVEALVKEESEALEDGHAHDQSFDEATKDEAEAPPAKRARRTAAVKAQINISHDSDEDEDVDGAEPITKIEDESDDSDGEEKDPSYTEVPGTSADDQAGPSGLGKDGVEAPSYVRIISDDFSGNAETFAANLKQEELIIKMEDPVFAEKPYSGSYICPTCFASFHSENDLYQHFSTHSKDNNGSIPCPFCPYQAKSKGALRAHLYYRHTCHTCMHCNQTCSSNYSMKNHILALHKDKHVCMVCYKFFLQEEKLILHQVRHHGGNVLLRQRRCKVCSREFLKRNALLEHQISSHKVASNLKIPVEHSCSKCSSKFPQEVELFEHMKSHFKGDVIDCPLCPFTAGRRDSVNRLLEHRMRRHYPQNIMVKIEARPQLEEDDNLEKEGSLQEFICPKCSFQCDSQKSLFQHCVGHGQNGFCPCLFCPYIGFNKQNLTIHLTSKHNT